MTTRMGRGQADIAAIALEDDGIYAWLGELNGDNDLIDQEGEPCISWKEVGGYSVAATREAISNCLHRPEYRSVSIVAFSSFGQIDRQGNALTSIPREEWDGEKNNFPLHFGEIVGHTLSHDVRVIVEHDVTASALAEWRWGNHTKRIFETNNDIFAYIRLGSGLGIEVLRKGELLHPDRRIEAGHMPIAINTVDRLKKTTCKAHEGCAEGRISRRAIDRRQRLPSTPELETSISQLLEDYDGPYSKAQAIESKILGDYLGQVIASLTMFVMCDIVVVGGKTLFNDHEPEQPLYDEIRAGAKKWLVKYPSYGNNLDINKYIVPASFRPEDAALTGLVDLAINEIRKDN